MFFENLTPFSVCLFLGVAFLILYIFFRKSQGEIQSALMFPGLFSQKYVFQKYSALFLSVICVLLVILGPVWKQESQTVGKGVDIVFALDVSKSMNVADMQVQNIMTTRLAAAKAMLGEFVRKHPENRYGLVIFSGEALSTVPLTHDSNTFLTMLQNVDYRNLTKQGSSISEALALANRRFEPHDTVGNMVLLISDGGDAEEQQSIPKRLKKQGVSYVVLGVGTVKGGKIITGQTPFGTYIFQKYKGQEVIAKLNEPQLKKVASTLQAEYLQLSSLKTTNIFTQIEKKSIEQANIITSMSMLRLLSMVSFVCFCVYLCISIFEKKGLHRKITR